MVCFVEEKENGLVGLSVDSTERGQRFRLRGRMGNISVGIVNADFFVMIVVMQGGRYLIGRVVRFGMKRFGTARFS